MILGALEIWHATALEIAWTVMGLIGCIISWGNLRWSRKDIDALAETNGHNLARYQVMRILAYGHFRNDAFRFCKHLAVLFIGVLSMILPRAERAPVITPSGLVVTGGLFTIVLLLLLASALDRAQRNAIDEMEDAFEKSDNGKEEKHG